MTETPTIFYSWQSDLPNSTNRGLIGEALVIAANAAAISAEQALRIDSDTQEEPGTPNIPAVIYTKISSAAIFVGDISFMGASSPRKLSLATDVQSEAKFLPNPNVLRELGFAAHCLGWGRVILVMNTAFGAPECLPFDLQQHTFPICYENRLEDAERATHRKTLAQKLGKKIKEVLALDHLQADRIRRKLDRACIGLLAHAAAQKWPRLSDDSGSLTREIARLLEVGVIYTNLDPDITSYGYEWTYLGSMVRDSCQPGRLRHARTSLVRLLDSRVKLHALER